jgi:cytochrome c peroxidase
MARAPRPAAPIGSTRLVAVAALCATSCGAWVDSWFCADEGCEWTADEWRRLSSLAAPPPPPPDPTNRFGASPQAASLGRALFFETRLAGPATQLDSLRRPSPPARAPRGEPSGVACASCHDLARGGADTSSVPGHVSVGTGWMDANALPVVGSAHRKLLTWNGRADNLWGLAAAVIENPIIMNGNRLRVAWTIADRHRAAYDEVFGPAGHPLPLPGGSAAVRDVVERDGPRAGQCRLGPGASCPEGCREATSARGRRSCWPRFPLEGKPGAQRDCQAGDDEGAGEPFGDAFDCMAEADRELVTRALVNAGKAIAAFVRTLDSRDAALDRFVREGPSSTALAPAARRGARLFVGKAACIDCHNGPQLTDDAFHNVGVPQAGVGVVTIGDCPAGGIPCDCVTPPDGRDCAPWGAFDGLRRLSAFPFPRTSKWSDDPSAGAPAVPPRTESLKGAWRTPSLRDVALTAPYMHDGVLKTLEEVLWHYDRGGGGEGAVGHRAPQIRPLALSEEERGALVEFLKALTGAPPVPGAGAAP